MPSPSDPGPSRRAFLLPGARPRQADGTAAPRVAQVGPGCLAHQGSECRVCGEVCEPGAIRFPPRLGGAPLPRVEAARCTGCGDCLPRCPATAMSLA